MGDFELEEKVDDFENSYDFKGKTIRNVKEFSVGNSDFVIRNGRLEIRDSSGNIVVLIDANG